MPDDVWSGVPDELRRLVRAYHDASLEAFNNAHSGFTSLARFDAAEAALAAALRDLVRRQPTSDEVQAVADVFRMGCTCGVIGVEDGTAWDRAQERLPTLLARLEHPDYQ